MKHCLFFALFLLSSVGVMAQFSGKGSGTSDDPYQITSADELFEVRNALSASYKLMNDIDLTEWVNENNPTGGWAPINYFYGRFDGNGKGIYGLYINRSSSSNIGLFGIMDMEGAVFNLRIQNAIVIGGENVGVIAGVASIGNIGSNNCVVNSKIKGTNHVGGIVGKGTVGDNNSVINPHIEGTDYVGGITGFVNEVSTTGDYLRANSVQLNNNYVVGGTIVGQQYVGGIVGYIEGRNIEHRMPGTVRNELIGNYCSASISAQKYAGGICGCAPSSYYFQGKKNTTTYGEYSTKLTLTDNSYDGKITCTECAGGMIGLLLKDGSSLQRGTGSQYQYVVMSRNLVKGCLYGEKNIHGLHGYSDHCVASSMNVIKYNVCMFDTLSASKDIPYRIVGQNIESSSSSGSSNYALTQSVVLSKGNRVSITDDFYNGSGLGEKVLKKKTTYEGMDFDFEEQWDLIEGETYPYNIRQSSPVAVTSSDSETFATILGTSTAQSGCVYVLVGDTCYEGAISNGQWSVQCTKAEEGQEAKITAVINNMMPSVFTTAIIGQVTNNNASEESNGETSDTDISTMENVVYIENVEGKAGDQLTLSVKMKNTVSVQGYGFDLYLPEGVTVATDEDDFPLVELSTERTTAKKTNSFNYTVLPNGALRVFATSTGGYTFSGNDGEVALVTVNISGDMEEGEYDVVMKEVTVTDSNSNGYDTDYVKSTLTISAYTLADVNKDGKINVTDFTAIANHMLGHTPEGFIEKAADVNGDGKVNVTDLTAVANIILYGSPSRDSQARNRFQTMWNDPQ